MPKSVARPSSRLAVTSQAVALESSLAKVNPQRGSGRSGGAKRVSPAVRDRRSESSAESASALSSNGHAALVHPASHSHTIHSKTAHPTTAHPTTAHPTTAHPTSARAASATSATARSAGESTTLVDRVSRPDAGRNGRVGAGTSSQPPAKPSLIATRPQSASLRPGTAAGADANSSPLLSLADDALLQRIRGGDLAAGDALIRRYAQPLLRYLQRLVGDDLAEELHQQTWVSVLDNLDKFDPTVATHNSGSGGFKAWLFRIATNKANDLWRSKGRERAAKEGLRLVSGHDTPWAGHKAEGREMEDKLIRAIGRLPETQRQVLALRYYSNMKFIDIAALLGCPLNTALGRVHKAMIKLRQLMDD